MSRPKPSPRHPMAASESGIDQAARLILSGRADEALKLLKAVDTLHRTVINGPVTQFGLAEEVDRLWGGLQDLEEKLAFSMELNDRMVRYMREAGVLEPVWDYLKANPDGPPAEAAAKGGPPDFPDCPVEKAAGGL